MMYPTPKPNPDPKIREFWEWFQTIAEELGDNLDDQELISVLDERVARLGDVSWEIGPGRHEENALVITPDGKREMLRTTQNIIAQAPQVPGWEFHWARPPREWDLRFSIEADSGRMLDIDARCWKYVLFELSDQVFDIVVEQSSLSKATESDRYTAAVVLLDGVLGEAKRLELIDSIETVVTLSDEHSGKANPIELLAAHLDSLCRRSGYRM